MEIGSDLNTTLSEIQMEGVKELLMNASWKSIREDLATTHYLMFDGDLLVDDWNWFESAFAYGR